MPILPAAAAALFVAIHLLIGKLKFLDVVPRSRWLSFAGGVAVAYVFLHVLPELTEHHQAFAQRDAEPLVVYTAALVGLVVFYALERALKGARQRSNESGERPAVLWLHIAAFALYNVLIGYLLVHRDESGAGALAYYVFGMGLHFLTTDFGLRQDHREQYDRVGRWVISAGVVAGFLLGLMVSLPATVIGTSFAFLAGGVVLNVLKEELPEERQSRLLPFLAGTAGYSAILLAG